MWLPLLSMHAAQAGEYTHPAAPDVHYSMAVQCGSITFRAGAAPQITVRGELDDLTPSFAGTDKNLRFVLPTDQASWDRHHNLCDEPIEVTVPTGASLDASTTNGDVTTQGVHGVLVLQTVNGDVTIADPGSEVRVTAVNGDVDVGGLRGEAELTTVNGDIKLDASELDDGKTQTVNGDTQVRSKMVKRLRSQTVRGDIQFAGALDPAARLEFESHSGDIMLRVPNDPGYVLAFESFSGDIQNGVSGVSATRPQYGPGTNLDTTVGSGSARIEAQTFSGDIVIEPPKK
jgi:DUF4097 and DUF4098 domain-containing protein YvlB